MVRQATCEFPITSMTELSAEERASVHAFTTLQQGEGIYFWDIVEWAPLPQAEAVVDVDQRRSKVFVISERAAHAA
eukprot:9613192-Lingulodinium_polyedra.AAC.1